jgi:hypothetical protein
MKYFLYICKEIMRDDYFIFKKRRYYEKRAEAFYKRLDVGGFDECNCLPVFE